MKNIYILKRLSKATLMTLVAALLIAVGFYACKKPNEGINLLVNTSSLSKSPVLIHFVNANPASTTAVTDFDVKITGKDASLVQMDGGSTTFKTSHGFLPLSLTQASEPSASNPVVFNIVASVNGFAPVLKTVIISEQNPQIIEVKLMEYNSPAPGVGVVTANTTLTAGTSGAADITVPSTATMPRKTKFSIAAGTQMLDANGNVINANQLSSNIIHYGSETPASLASFPGGLYAPNVVDVNNAPIAGGVNFVTAGCLSINMKAGNTEVKKFSKPIAVVEEIDPNLTNFDNGNAIAPGDVIPLWSLNEETGQWKREPQDAVVIKTADNKLAASFNISHLSGWNLDWAWYGQNTSSTPLTINLLPSKTPWVGNYEVQLQTATGGYLAGFHSYRPEADGFEKQINNFPSYPYYVQNAMPGKYGFLIAQVPVIANAKVNVRDNRTGQVVGESGLFNPVTAGTVNVNITTPAPPDYVDVYLKVTTRCTTKSIEGSPSGWYYMYDVNDSGYTYFYLYNGVVYNYSYGTGAQGGITTNGIGGSVKMINGHRYYMQTYYNNQWLSTEFVFTKGSFTLPANLGLSGNATYNATNNSVSINAFYNMACK